MNCQKLLKSFLPLVALFLSIRVCFAETSSWDKYMSAGAAAYKQGQYNQAEKSLYSALQEAEKFGPKDTRLATTLNNLAELNRAQGKYAEAEPLLKRSLQIMEKALGPNHPDVAGSLNNLAALYGDQGKYAEAEPLCKRSLEIRERALGPNHPDVAMSLENYARLLRKTDRTGEAEKLETRAKAIRAGHT